jgi:hypothetical protein
MPEFITEDQYVAVKSAIDNPPPGTTDFHMNEWKGYTARYQEQQKRGGFTELTPKRASEAFKRSTENIYNTEKLYKNGIEGIDISNEPDQGILTNPLAKATRANKKALAEFYSVDVTPGNYGQLKAQFIADPNNGLVVQDSADEMEFYQAAAPVFQQRAEARRQQIAQFGAASKEYLSGNNKDEAITNLKKNNLYNPEIFNGVWQDYELFGKPVEPKVDAVLDVLERRTKPAFLEKYKAATKKTDEQIKLEDDAVIKDFSETLVNIHPDRRLEIIQRVGGLAEKRGKASIKDVRNLGNTLTDSALQMFQGFEGYNRLMTETNLDTPEFKFNVGEVIQSNRFKNITNVQEARQFLIGKLNAATSLPTAVGPGAQPAPPPKPNDIVITEEMNQLLKDAKADLKNLTSLSRDIMNVQNAVDPFETDVLSTMARVTGTSIGIIGVNALARFTGLGALAMGGSATMYTGLNYDTIRSMYPDMAPDKARNAAATAGILEMGLDQAGLGLMLKIVKGAPASAASKYLRKLTPENVYGRAGINAMAAYFVESGIEFGQEGLRPATLALFSQMSKEYQVDLELEKELYKEAAPDILIGMLPLALGGGVISGGKMVFDERKFRAIVANRDAQRMFGFSDDQIDLLQTLVADNKLFSAQDKYNEFRKDETRKERVIEQLRNPRVVDSIDNVVRTQQSLQFLKERNILPNYDTVADENGELRYRKENDATLYTEEEFLSELDSRVSQELKAIEKGITMDENGVQLSPMELTEDSANANQENLDTIFTLKGLNETDLAQIKGIFGNSDAQRRLVFSALLDYDLNTRDGMELYLDKIYNNILPADRATLGATREEGIKNLSAAILGLNSNTKAEGDTTNTSPDINDTMADEIEYSEYDRDSLASEDRQEELADVNAALDAVAQRRAGVATDITIRPVSISNLDTEQSQGLNSIVDLFKSKYNIETIFVRGAKDSEGNFVGPIGVSLGNAIVIDIDQAKGSILPHVLGHEFSHSLQTGPNVRLWNEMKDAIKGEAGTGVFEQFTQRGITEEEFVADTVGSRFRDLDFWNKLTTRLAKKDQGLANNLIKSVKGFFSTLKSDIMQGAGIGSEFVDVRKGLFRSIDKVENSIVSTMLKATKLAPMGGRPQYMEFGSGLNQNPRIQYLAHTLRNQINLAMAEIQRQGGGVEGRKKAKSILTDPQTSEAYNGIVEYYKEKYKSSVNREIDGKKKVGNTARSLQNRMYKAIQEGNVDRLLIAELEGFFANNPNAITMDFNTANELLADVDALNDYFTESVKGITTLRENIIKGVETKANIILGKMPAAIAALTNITDSARDNLMRFYGKLAEVFQQKDIVLAEAELNRVFDQLYDTNGLPKSVDADLYEKLIQDYYIHKTFGAWNDRIIDEQEDIINTLFKWAREEGPTDRFVDPVADQNISRSINEIAENKYTETRPKKGAVTRINYQESAVLSYIDDHQALFSLLEKVSPAEKRQGKGLTDSLQRLSDELIESQVNRGLQLERLAKDVSDTVIKVFGLKDGWFGKKRAHRVLYDIASTKVNPINVVIKGKSRKLTQSFGAYIINIAEQFVYNEQLAKAGITEDVIKEIRSGLTPEVNKLRIALRDDLIKLTTKTNSILNNYGKAVKDVGNFYFPAIKKDTKSRLIDGFDIHFGGGLKADEIRGLYDRKGELDLDFDSQEVNLLSVYNSHTGVLVHNANTIIPVNNLKKVLNDPRAKNKIEENLGQDFYRALFKSLDAVESGGIRVNELNKGARKIWSTATNNVARSQLAFNINTYAVNTLSLGNFFLDDSLPLMTKVFSTMRLLGSLDAYAHASLNFTSLFGLGRKSPRFLAAKKLALQRLDMGSNTLINMSRMGEKYNKPGGIISGLDQFVNKGMEAIGWIDTYALTFGAIAAYDAHKRIGAKQGLTGKALESFAEAGMRRTIIKTSQPNTLATKPVGSQSTHPLLRMSALFMGEVMSKLGLQASSLPVMYDLKSFKKKSLSGLQHVLFQHIVMGGGYYSLRLLIGAEGDDEWDENELAELGAYIAAGPLSGFLVFGSVLESNFKGIWNAMVPEDYDVTTFQAQSPLARTVSQITQISKIMEGEGSIADNIEDIGETIEAVGTMTGNAPISNVGTTLDNILQSYKRLRDLFSDEE